VSIIINMGRKSEGYIRVIPKSGRNYLVKVKSVREGEKVKQKFLYYIGSLEDVKKVICDGRFCPRISKSA